MTLNITVASSNGIHQSSDLRLVAFDADQHGNWISMEDNSPKLITLTYKDWAGYLTYCGVGKWNYKSTYVHATEWIASLGGGASFEDMVSVLQVKGSSWICHVQKCLGRFQGHTFIIGAYVRALPRVAIVSNTHSTRGSIRRRSDTGLGVSISDGMGPHVFVTGLDSAVTKQDRIALKRMSERRTAANVIRHRLAQINEKAASSREAKNGISPSCMCYSIDSLGGGGGELYGPVAGRLVPVHLVDGLDCSQMLGQHVILGPDAQVRTTAFATSASSDAIAAERIDCTIQFLADGAVRGHDLSDINNQHVEIASTNGHATLVGQLRKPVSSSPHAFVWVKGHDILDLQTFGGATSHAADVNNANVVVGNALTQDNKWKAFVWRDGYGLRDLGALHGDNSAAVAINDHDVIVGYVQKNAVGQQPEFRRAFRWTESTGMEYIPTMEGRWSEALDVNDDGWILGRCYERGQICAFVWTGVEGLQLLERPVGRPFHASCISSAGIVAGEGDDENGIRRALIWSADVGFQELNVPFRFHPMSIDDEGNIVGYESSRPWTRAWIVPVKGKPISLLGGADHSIDVRQVAGRTIVGHARGDGWKHVHPIVWDFDPRVCW